jgi:hypothetical protein
VCTFQEVSPSTVYTFFSFSIQATYIAYHNHLDFTALRTLNKSWSSSSVIS